MYATGLYLERKKNGLKGGVGEWRARERGTEGREVRSCKSVGSSWNKEPFSQAVRPRINDD